MQYKKTKIAIIGSTGSIGISALDVVREHKDKFEICALAAGSNTETLIQQIEEFHPRFAALANEQAAQNLKKSINEKIEIRAGKSGVASLCEIQNVDIVLVAVVGIAGLEPAMKTLRAGKRLALATKEVLVAAGQIIIDEAKKNNAEILPVDSEHCAIFQCMLAAGALKSKSVERLILTASGGPFFGKNLEDLKNISPEQALAHPTWNMGSKISIDSATLMNKGLEVIEASRLFDIPAERIDVVVHPQSIIHSLVDFCDGAAIAQMSNPDMRMPILYAFTFPARAPLNMPPLDLAQIAKLTFYEPDRKVFPCLDLAYDALKAGGIMPAVLNAANEVAVQKFLNGKIAFLDIPSYIEKKMKKCDNINNPTLDDVIAADNWAREEAAPRGAPLRKL